MVGNPHRMNSRTGGRLCARRLLATAMMILMSASAVPAVAVPQNDPAVTVSEERGVYTVAATFSVPQAPRFVFAALTDYAGIPRFMPEVRTSNVIARADDRTVVEQEATARFMMFSKRVHLVLEVQEGESHIRFRDRCGKSFTRYEGVWTITGNGATTQVRYELSARPSFDVPELLLKRLFKRDATQMIERLTIEIRARAR